MLRRVARPVLRALGRNVLLQRGNALPFDPICTNSTRSSKGCNSGMRKGKRNAEIVTTAISLRRRDEW
jgi:hypothetical protein